VREIGGEIQVLWLQYWDSRDEVCEEEESRQYK
jgi:hypothetical protein